MLIQEDKIHESWKNLLTPEFLREMDYVEQQIGNNFYPVSDKVMRFLETDLGKAKCVIIGMEPYPSYYLRNGEMIPVATGRSFEIANVTDWREPYKQASLHNILKAVYYNKTGEKKSLDEIREEMDQKRFQIAPPPKWFDSLEQQGVLFLNATLTVHKGKPDSHTAIWKKTMDMIIRYIDENANVKWLLFGNKAMQRVTETLGEKKNIKKYSHPRNIEFISENPFKDVPEIRWNGIRHNSPKEESQNSRRRLERKNASRDMQESFMEWRKIIQGENKDLFYDALVELRKSRQTDEEGFFSFTYNELCIMVHLGKNKVKNCLLQLATEGKISLIVGTRHARTKAKIIG